MKAYSLITIFICCICEYTLVDIMPELKRNILNFGYGMIFKYEGMLLHSFDRFYRVTKFILPTINDLKFSKIDFDSECSYLNVDLRKHRYPMQYLSNIKNFCKKIVPFIDFYKKQIDYYNKTIHDILTKEIPLILPNFPKHRKEKRGIITLLVTGFTGFISNYLHNKRQKTLKNAFMAMENQVNLEQIKISHLEDLMVMYGIYNSDTLEKLINTVYKIHNTTTWNERLFVVKSDYWYQ